jgi:formylglycine-generating enzyme
MIRLTFVGSSFLILLFCACTCINTALALTMPTVLVADVGNAPGVNGYGSVAYSYRIGKFEVTNAQYAEFLNSVAKTDPYGLFSESVSEATYGGIVRSGAPGSYSYAVKPPAIGLGFMGADYTYENKPIPVNWYDAIRFANWMHNGQGDGDTETGAYTILGGTEVPLNGEGITRNPGAKWFLTNENEWYKAASYDPNKPGGPGYFDFATRSNTSPNNNHPSMDTGNSANYRVGSKYSGGSRNYPGTDVGAYALSESAYGTFDQTGNYSEWTEGLVGLERVFRGGDWLGSPLLDVGARVVDDPTHNHHITGFRLAQAVPEPSGFVIAVAAVTCWATKRSRTQRTFAGALGRRRRTGRIVKDRSATSDTRADAAAPYAPPSP